MWSFLLLLCAYLNTDITKDITSLCQLFYTVPNLTCACSKRKILQPNFAALAYLLVIIVMYNTDWISNSGERAYMNANEKSWCIFYTERNTHSSTKQNK